MDGRPWGVMARHEMGPALLGACSHLKSQQQAHSHPSAGRDPNFPTTGAWRASAACKYLSGWVLRPGAPPLETLLGSGAVTCSDARKVGKGHYMKPLSSTHPPKHLDKGVCQLVGTRESVCELVQNTEPQAHLPEILTQ